MKMLNKFESDVLARVADKYPSLKEHIPYLRVSSRKITGVGMFVDFDYSQTTDIPTDLDPSESFLSTNENIEISGLNYGLGFEVVISEGKIQFIEFITYGEKWDGSVNSFQFT